MTTPSELLNEVEPAKDVPSLSGGKRQRPEFLYPSFFATMLLVLYMVKMIFVDSPNQATGFLFGLVLLPLICILAIINLVFFLFSVIRAREIHEHLERKIVLIGFMVIYLPILLFIGSILALYPVYAFNLTKMQWFLLTLIAATLIYVLIKIGWRSIKKRSGNRGEKSIPASRSQSNRFFVFGLGVLVVIALVFVVYPFLFTSDKSFRSRVADTRTYKTGTSSPRLATYVHDICSAGPADISASGTPRCMASFPAGDIALLSRADVEYLDEDALYVSIPIGGDYYTELDTETLTERGVVDDPSFARVFAYPDDVNSFWVFADRSLNVFVDMEDNPYVRVGQVNSGELSDEESPTEVYFRFRYPYPDRQGSLKESDYPWNSTSYHIWTENGVLYEEAYATW